VSVTKSSRIRLHDTNSEVETESPETMLEQYYGTHCLDLLTVCQVYLEPHQLGVSPLLTSWLNTLPPHYPVRVKGHVVCVYICVRAGILYTAFL
jgi:hypothetical protein